MTADERMSWKEMIRELGESVVALLRAEVQALSTDLGRSGKTLGFALALFGAAGILVFWALGTLTAALIALAAIWMSWLSATLLVFALWVVAALALAGWGWLKLKKWQAEDTPLLAVERRFQNHVQWWENRVLPPPEEGSPPPDQEDGE